QPVSIAYTRLNGMPIGRRFRPLFAWYGAMAMAPHLWRVLGLGTIEVTVEFHPSTTLAACGSRKMLARYCEERVKNGVALALSGRRRPRTTAPAGPTRRPAAADAAAPALGGARRGPRPGTMQKRPFIQAYGCQIDGYDSARNAAVMTPPC